LVRPIKQKLAVFGGKAVNKIIKGDKMKKKYFKVISFAIMFIFFFTVSSTAQDNAKIGVSIDGEEVVFNDSYGYPFIDSNNRTLVPMRITLEKAGATVSWDNESKTAKAEKDGITVIVTIGKNFIVINNEVRKIDTAAIIKDGRTYLPIRAVLEAFGYSINWNYNTKTVEAVNLQTIQEITKSIANNVINFCELNDENGNLYYVVFFHDDAEIQYMRQDSAIWAGANLGEYIIEGNFKVASIKYDNGTPEIQIVDFQYNNGDKIISDNIQINLSREKIFTIDSKKSNTPDILFIGIIQGSNVTANSGYYIKNGTLTRIGTVYSTTPIVHIKDNQFYTLKYVGQVSDNLWDKITLEFDNNQGKFNIVSTEAVTDDVENYESYKLYK
jgi:hypothetical protein